jgi:hypothetical protein
MSVQAERQPLASRPRHLSILTETIDDHGRYDAVKIAKLLDWSGQEIAQYLDKDPSAISRNGASLNYQQPLSQLAATITHLLALLDNDLKTARAWLRTPIKVLDGKSPKEKILLHDLNSVDGLLSEVEGGLSV